MSAEACPGCGGLHLTPNAVVECLSVALDAERARADAAEAEEIAAVNKWHRAERRISDLTAELAFATAQARDAEAEADALRARAERLEAAIRQAPHETHCLAFENEAHEGDCSCGIGEWKSAALTEGDA